MSFHELVVGSILISMLVIGLIAIIACIWVQLKGTKKINNCNTTHEDETPETNTSPNSKRRQDKTMTRTPRTKKKKR
ncbi:hypothetical protein BLOT_001844 [Blomia tropicalis]|nr:hypothetical protein BLOT_001844 [Blomia tropicalis]